MDTIQNLSRIWNNGAISGESLSVEEIENFKSNSGAKKVVGSKWTYRGKEYETPFYVRLLADHTGVIHFENDDVRTSHLVVRNGDFSERSIIKIPRIDKNSRPKHGYLNLPPSSANFGGIEWGCEGNDGFTDYLFEFDWNTGKLLRFARPSRPW
jgi:hypothetical protein